MRVCVFVVVETSKGIVFSGNTTPQKTILSYWRTIVRMKSILLSGGLRKSFVRRFAGQVPSKGLYMYYVRMYVCMYVCMYGWMGTLY